MRDWWPGYLHCVRICCFTASCHKIFEVLTQMALPLLLPELLYNSNQRTRNLEQHQLDCKRVTEQLFRFKFFFSERLYILQLSLRPMLPPTGPYIKNAKVSVPIVFTFSQMSFILSMKKTEIQQADWPTADLILLSLTVALLLPGPRRPCSLLTCLVTPCRLVLTSSITVAELGVCCCFFTLVTSGRKHMAKRQAQNPK